MLIDAWEDGDKSKSSFESAVNLFTCSELTVKATLASTAIVIALN